MLKKLGAALAVGALALTIHAGVSTSALSAAEPQPPAVPQITVTPATCDNKTNLIQVTGFTPDAYKANYRFVVFVEGEALALKQIPTKNRQLLLTGEPQDILKVEPKAAFAYGKNVTIKSYWFNNDAAVFKYPNAEWETVRMQNGELQKAKFLGASEMFTLVDPTKLNCPAPAPGDATTAPADPGQGNTTAPADPGQGNTTAPADPGGGNQSPVTAPIATAPEAPTFTLTAAQCVEGKATDNVMTVDKSQVNDNLRFVATHDGKSISLKSELRAKLWTAGKLTAEDIKTAYPSFNFDYSKPMTVQPYFFDKEKAYAESLYDTTLQLTVGKSDRFIKLGDPKSLVLVDKTTLNCAPAPTDEPTTVPTGEPSTAPTGEPSTAPTGEPSTAPTGEPSTAPTGEPTPAASVTPSATASAAASVKPTASGPAAKKGKLAKTGFDSALAVTAFALMAGAGALLALKKRREASSGS